MNMIEEAKAARAISHKIRKSVPLQTLRLIGRGMLAGEELEQWKNDIYSVNVREYLSGAPFTNGPYRRLGIFCNDGQPRHDWRDFQQIKNQLCGPEWEAIELYPAESRLQDPSNYYILYCVPCQFDFGIKEPRHIENENTCIAPQRGWADERKNK